MTIMDVPVAVREAKRARALRDIGDRDYKRYVVELSHLGKTQAEIARLLQVAQPTVQKMLKRSEALQMPAEGFSGADPYEICERYAADLISREQLIDELTRWDYPPRGKTPDEFDDLIVPVPGSVEDLERALRRGLIDDELFDEIADRYEERNAGE